MRSFPYLCAVREPPAGVVAESTCLFTQLKTHAHYWIGTRGPGPCCLSFPFTQAHGVVTCNCPREGGLPPDHCHRSACFLGNSLPVIASQADLPVDSTALNTSDNSSHLFQWPTSLLQPVYKPPWERPEPGLLSFLPSTQDWSR